MTSGHRLGRREQVDIAIGVQLSIWRLPPARSAVPPFAGAAALVAAAGAVGRFTPAAAMAPAGLSVLPALDRPVKMAAEGSFLASAGSGVALGLSTTLIRNGPSRPSCLGAGR